MSDYSEVDESTIEDQIPISDKPELISPQEVPSPELDSEPKEPHIAHLVCDICLELNLTTKSVIACVGCGLAFCYHFQSAVDSQFCVNCLSDISVTKQVITKTYEHHNPETGEASFYRRRAREIKIDGLSWLFAQRRIVDLSDPELDMAIEYHRNICSLMITESERRRNEKMHRYAHTPMPIPTPSTTKIENGTTTTTTVKKTRTVSKTKQTETVAAILASLQAKGMSIQDILKAVKK